MATDNWLNDDEHGVRLAHATVFPDGPGLGAAWNKTLLYFVGAAIGQEARGGHNGFEHAVAGSMFQQLLVTRMLEIAE